ncbi:hypothetical protein AB0I81_63990 [Nonomuraea sp. NPDC050404]
MFRTTGALIAATLGTPIIFAPSSASTASDWECYDTRAVQDSVELAHR